MEFSKPDETTSYKLPLFLEPVKAGFPSPADDYVEQSLDLNDLLIQHPSATFFVRVKGRSMEDEGIYEDDILVVDRAVTGAAGKIVIAILNGEFTVKRLQMEGNTVCLFSGNPQFPPLKIDPQADFQVWGVVTYVIHKT